MSRISAELKAEGVKVGGRLVSSSMKRQNLPVIRSKRYMSQPTVLKYQCYYNSNLLRERLRNRLVAALTRILSPE